VISTYKTWKITLFHFHLLQFNKVISTYCDIKGRKLEKLSSKPAAPCTHFLTDI